MPRGRKSADGKQWEGLTAPMADVLAEKLHLLLLVQQGGILEQYHRGQHVAADQRVEQHPCPVTRHTYPLSSITPRRARPTCRTRGERTQINGGSGADDGASVRPPALNHAPTRAACHASSARLPATAPFRFPAHGAVGQSAGGRRGQHS